MRNNSEQVPKITHAATSPIKLANRWDCSRQHIYNLIDERKLKAFYLGRHVRISFEEIERYERGDE